MSGNSIVRFTGPGDQTRKPVLKKPQQAGQELGLLNAEKQGEDGNNGRPLLVADNVTKARKLGKQWWEQTGKAGALQEVKKNFSRQTSERRGESPEDNKK